MEDSGHFNIIDYSCKYCLIDTKVLADGLKKFRDLIWNNFGVDSLGKLSLSSVATDIMKMYNVYEGIYSLYGVPRHFCEQANVGGRVMAAFNKPVTKNEKYQDIDVNSLYPAAQASSGGYPKGPAKAWDGVYDLNQADHYVVEGIVQSVTCDDLPFPAASFLSTDELTGSTTPKWSNDLVGRKIIANKQDWDSLIKYHGATVTFTQGYYWNEGLNNKVEGVINMLFQMRKEYKEAGNPLQNVIKLIMNTAYGKTGLKPGNAKVEFIKNRNKLDEFIMKNYYKINGPCVLLSNGTYMVKVKEPKATHKNQQHISALVLARSKQIMNELFHSAKLVGADMTYTDTDSVHMQSSKVPLVAQKYEELYGKKMLGKGLGQLSNDFDPFAKDENGKSVKGVYSAYHVVLGKKTYLDILQDDAGNVGCHVRGKGIPVKVNENKALRTYGQECDTKAECVYKLFQHMAKGEQVTYDLEDGALVFEKGKNMEIMSGSLSRTVQFQEQQDVPICEVF